MEIRPALPERDYERILALINIDESEPYTLSQYQHWLREEPGRMYRTRVAVDDQDEVIGYSEVVHETWYAPGRYYLWVCVDPRFLRQGIGSALYAEAEAFALAQGAAVLTTDMRDNNPAAFAFAGRFGYSLDRHLFESVLDLDQFDETPFSDCIATLSASGIRFYSLADFDNTVEARRKLYEVNTITVLQIPGSRGEMPTFEQFEKEVAGSEWFNPEGQLLAADGEQFIGLSAVRLYPESRSSYNLMTGVLEAYRGRKIALALKLLAIRYARSCGAKTMRTHNDSRNAPILAINRKLGYQPQPGKYFLRKVVG
ncbi:MAG: GNAT family N-acetyltransferase [Chloroflexi bacterium]|nr:MAG: GNAT family N-acetyltransferase [Chloroflexota bacterium]